MSADPTSKYDGNGSNFCKSRSDTYPFISPRSADLSGRHVLVTGASKGVGRATAISYAQAGASAIAVAARSSFGTLADEIRAAALSCGRLEPKVVPLNMDISARAEVEAAAAAAAAALGHLDILILNAAVLEPIVKLLDSDPDVWWRTHEVNLRGTYLCLRAFLPLLLKSPNPDRTVVGLTSVGATMTAPGFSAYQSGKLTICRYMEFVNAEYGAAEDGGVLAFAVHPGSIMTDICAVIPEHLHHLLKDTPQMSADSLVWLTKERREWLRGRYVSCSWE